jgi:hypothetical protein
LINGDTIVAITLDQSREVNKVFLEANYYKIVSDTLGGKILLLNSRIKNDSIIINDKNYQISNLDSVIYNQKNIIDRQKIDQGNTDDKLIKEQRKNKIVKKITLPSIILNVFLVIVTLISIGSN